MTRAQKAELAFWKNFKRWSALVERRYRTYWDALGTCIQERRPWIVADIGSGPIPFALFMKASYKIAVDPLYQEYCKIPRWRLFMEAMDQLELSTNALGDCSVDCVLLLNVLDHVPDPAELLRDALRILRRGGWIFIYVDLRKRPNTMHPGIIKPKELRAIMSEARSCDVVVDRILKEPFVHHKNIDAWIFAGKINALTRRK